MVARLHHDRVAAAPPAAWAFLTHGIYGSGGNWRTIARQVTSRRPEWGFVLVDLRQHGRSEPGPPPHTVDACADDLAALAQELAAAGQPISVAVGHSFGGKVVLALRPRLRPAQTWVLDSAPGARPHAWEAADNSVRDVWASMRALDRDWPSREAFVAAMVGRGHPPALAQWVAMNLAPAAGAAGATGALRLRLELDAVRALLLDYYARDAWPELSDPGLPGEVHVVLAARSSAVAADERARLAALPPPVPVHVHVVDAGHWLHVDAPAAVVDLLATHLPAPPAGPGRPAQARAG